MKLKTGLLQIVLTGALLASFIVYLIVQRHNAGVAEGKIQALTAAVASMQTTATPNVQTPPLSNAKSKPIVNNTPPPSDQPQHFAFAGPWRIYADYDIGPYPTMLESNLTAKDWLVKNKWQDGYPDGFDFPRLDYTPKWMDFYLMAVKGNRTSRQVIAEAATRGCRPATAAEVGIFTMEVIGFERSWPFDFVALGSYGNTSFSAATVFVTSGELKIKKTQPHKGMTTRNNVTADFYGYWTDIAFVLVCRAGVTDAEPSKPMEPNLVLPSREGTID
jgi:hypothetical protein